MAGMATQNIANPFIGLGRGTTMGGFPLCHRAFT
jgi:hypothetical protein